jgi:hypothetical protein
MNFIRRIFGIAKNISVGTSVDSKETRTFQVLAPLDREQALSKYPDFDLAYIRAAYASGNSGDHRNAKPHILKKGLGKCRRKSLLLGRLSAYSVWKGEAENALQHATNSLLATKAIPSTPGDLVGCINLLHTIFTTCGFNDVAMKMKQLNPGFEESPEMQSLIEKVARKLSSKRHSSAVESTATALRGKQCNSNIRQETQSSRFRKC